MLSMPGIEAQDWNQLSAHNISSPLYNISILAVEHSIYNIEWPKTVGSNTSRYPLLSYNAGDTDQCFLLPRECWVPLQRLPKHRWQKTALSFHVAHKTSLLYFVQCIAGLGKDIWTHFSSQQKWKTRQNTLQYFYTTFPCTTRVQIFHVICVHFYMFVLNSTYICRTASVIF